MPGPLFINRAPNLWFTPDVTFDEAVEFLRLKGFLKRTDLRKGESSQNDNRSFLEFRGRPQGVNIRGINYKVSENKEELRKLIDALKEDQKSRRDKETGAASELKQLGELQKARLSVDKLFSLIRATGDNQSFYFQKLSRLAGE